MADIWVGQDGERYGPFTESVIRQGMADGKFSAQALGWRRGMPEWLPLASVVGRLATPASLFTPPRSPSPPDTGAMAVDETQPGPNPADIPAPPNLHWLLVLLLCVVTLGLFVFVWQFTQANWVKRISPSSNARKYLIVGFGFAITSVFAQIIADERHEALSSTLQRISSFSSLVNSGFFLAAYFSMRQGIERAMRPYGLNLKMSATLIFFFNLFFMQGQMSWIARWRLTGQTEPPAPTKVFWLLILIPLVLGVIIAFTSKS